MPVVQFWKYSSVVCLLLLVTTASSNTPRNRNIPRIRCRSREICRFRHCRQVRGTHPSLLRRLTLRPPLVPPVAPVICLNDIRDTVGFVLRTGEAIVEQPGAPDVNISQWRPSKKLSPVFPRDFFKTVKVPVLKKSGIVKVANKGNQHNFLNGICLRLPIIKYEKVNRNTRIVEEVITGRKPSDCITFSTATTGLLIELSWEGRDDLDLKVIEPSGKPLDRFQPTSTCGSFSGDRNAEKCFSKNKIGKESMMYFTEEENCGRRALKGTYSIEVFHHTRCGGKPTKWVLRVSVAEELKMIRKGMSDTPPNEPILNTTFTF